MILMTLLIVPLFTAGIIIVGLQQASAGSVNGTFCGDPIPSVNPAMIDKTLQPGESHEVTKVFEPNNEGCDFVGFEPNEPFTQQSNCNVSGFISNIQFDAIQDGDFEWTETITVDDDAEPGEYHCTILWRLLYSDSANGDFAPTDFTENVFVFNDNAGDVFTVTVTQQIWITVPDPVILVHIDIKPQSCPNPVNINSRGDLPVAILGNLVAVDQIDVDTIRLAGVSPIRDNIEDVATPHTPDTAVLDPNDCTIKGPDGIDDLTLKFDTQQVLDALEVSRGDVRQVLLTGFLLDGTEIHSYDTIIIK